MVADNSKGNSTRRSFIKSLLGVAMAPAAVQAAAPKKLKPGFLKKGAKVHWGIPPSTPPKAPTPKNTQENGIISAGNSSSKEEKLIQLYMTLCEQLEGDIPFPYQNADFPTVGCGVLFQNFKELDELPAFRIIPKKGCSIKLDKAYLEKIATADWTNPKTRFPGIERVERIKLKDCKGEFPNSDAKTWGPDKPLFWTPKETRKKANRYAAEFCVKKAKEIHHRLAKKYNNSNLELFNLPPSVRMVIVDLIYNLGDAKYDGKNNFPNFKRALRERNYINMKKECTAKNTRRDTVRQWLVESARLASSNLPEAQINQKLRKGIARSFFLSPVREPKIWAEIDRCTKANCTENAAISASMLQRNLIVSVR